MCRNIRVLFNFAPPATEAEMRAAALQYVRKVSGAAKPSHANQASFDSRGRGGDAGDAEAPREPRDAGSPRNREVEAVRAKQRSIKRFG